MEPQAGVGIGVSAVWVFQTGVHAHNHAVGAWLQDCWGRLVPNHALASVAVRKRQSWLQRLEIFRRNQIVHTRHHPE